MEKLRCYTIHFVRHLTMLKEPAFKQDSGSVTFFSYFIGQCYDNAKRVNQSQPGREGGKPKHAANLLLIVTFVSYHRRRNVTSVSVVLEELFVKPQHCTLSQSKHDKEDGEMPTDCTSNSTDRGQSFLHSAHFVGTEEEALASKSYFIRTSFERKSSFTFEN